MIAVEVGQVVTGVPVGRSRRQTVHVTGVDADGGLVHGLLVSKKYPGDFRGAVSLWADTVEAVGR